MTSLTDGGFVVVWGSYGQDGSEEGIYGQRYNSNGDIVGSEFRINSTTADWQSHGAVTGLVAGGFVVTWESLGQDGSGDGIYTQRYDANGNEIGGEIRINTYSTNHQVSPAIAIASDGSIIVTWASVGQDGNLRGVYAHHYAAESASAHTFTGGDGNDVFIGGGFGDTISGGGGDDQLDGGAGADNPFGSAGDDILVWDSSDATIDGGTGSDTVRVESGDADLTTFAGTITGIEEIDLEADTGANTLTLAVQDVLDISDTDVLTVLGDSGDSVDAGTGWTDGGFDGSGNYIYTQMVGASLATLVVDPDGAVNPDILM